MHKQILPGMVAGLFSILAVTTAHGQNSKEELFQQMKEADKLAPKVADAAPLFKLKSMDGNSETDLEKLHQEKPVVLIFGSYT